MSDVLLAHRTKVKHMPALDGARGIFVILGPVFYHLRPKLLPGGVLCLDLFFVLSSFLIVRLLLAEWARNDRIDLKAYAGRRARRLLPALIPTMGVLALYLVFFGTPDIVDKWAAGIASSLTYMMNWLEIWRGNSYWDAQTAESPVRHLWSFAVEEQFYLFAPLFLIFCLSRYKRNPAAAIIGFCTVGAIASAMWMSYLHHPGQDPTRAYYGTDTRAHTILIGIILAVLVHQWGPIRTAGGRLAANVVGLVCTVVFVYMLFVVDAQSSWMFEYGGFVLVALLTSAIIFAASQPQSWLHPILASKPAMAAGIVSYGIYLYHQPINKLLTAERAHLEGWPLDILRFSLTIGLAYASYHLYEKKVAKSHAVDGAKGLAWALGGTAVVFGILLFAVLTTNSTSEATPNQIVLGGNEQSTPPTFNGIGGVDRPLRVMVVGDSVMDQIGKELIKYSLDHPDQITVLNKARIGCGITSAEQQRYTDPDGTVREGATDPVCYTWPDTVAPQDIGDPDRLAWPTAVEWFKPDVVLMYPSPWDSSDRKLAKLGDEWVYPGVEAYDADLKGEYERAMKTVTASGAKVYYMTSPDLGDGRSTFDSASPQRFDRMSELFGEALAATDVNAVAIDYEAWLGPVGEERELELRRDGVHFSDKGVKEFTDYVLTDFLLARR